MRLQKFLAQAGVASRRKSEKLIEQGVVEVNDKIVTELGVKIDPEKDIVKVEGKRISGPEEKIYIILNKPKGYITSNKDPQGRKTVMELIDNKERVYPVGRLDLHSRGLILMTNNGELAFRLTHPSYQVSKTYLVRIDAPLAKSDQKKLVSGIKLEEGTAMAEDVIPQKNSKTNKEEISGETKLKIILKEGKKRQIRRMLKTLGIEVLDLKRIKFGPLSLLSLPEGSYRHLTKEEIEALKTAVSMNAHSY